MRRPTPCRRQVPGRRSGPAGERGRRQRGLDGSGGSRSTARSSERLAPLRELYSMRCSAVAPMSPNVTRSSSQTSSMRRFACCARRSSHRVLPPAPTTARGGADTCRYRRASCTSLAAGRAGGHADLRRPRADPCRHAGRLSADSAGGRAAQPRVADVRASTTRSSPSRARCPLDGARRRVDHLLRRSCRGRHRRAARSCSRGRQGSARVSPFTGLPTPVVASAWGKQLQLDAVDDPRLAQFVDYFDDGPQTPEKNTPCDQGTTDTD